MNRLFVLGISMAIVAAGTAAPASAQAWRLSNAASQEIRQDVNQIDRQVTQAEQRRRLSRREATSLHRQADALRVHYRRYAANGLSRNEVVTLERGINAIRERLNLNRRDWDGRR